MNIGEPTKNRLVVFAITSFRSDPFSIISPTINGVTASIAQTSGSYRTAFIWAYVPTGDTATLTCNVQSTSGVAVYAYALSNIKSDTPVKNTGSVSNQSFSRNEVVIMIAGGQSQFPVFNGDLGLPLLQTDSIESQYRVRTGAIVVDRDKTASVSSSSTTVRLIISFI
jgi:hypothetical protein